MAVDQVSGTEFPHKPKEDPESQMATIRLIMNAPRRGVGHQDIQRTSPEQPVEHKAGDQFKNAKQHLELGELVPAVIILNAASETRHQEPLDLEYFPVNIVAA